MITKNDIGSFGRYRLTFMNTSPVSTELVFDVCGVFGGGTIFKADAREDQSPT